MIYRLPTCGSNRLRSFRPPDCENAARREGELVDFPSPASQGSVRPPAPRGIGRELSRKSISADKKTRFARRFGVENRAARFQTSVFPGRRSRATALREPTLALRLFLSTKPENRVSCSPRPKREGGGLSGGQASGQAASNTSIGAHLPTSHRPYLRKQPIAEFLPLPIAKKSRGSALARSPTCNRPHAASMRAPCALARAPAPNVLGTLALAARA